MVAVGDNVERNAILSFYCTDNFLSRKPTSRHGLWLPATRSRLRKWDASGGEGFIACRRRRFSARARRAFGAALWEAIESLLEERGTKRDELPVVLDEPRVVLHKVGRRLRRVRPSASA